MTNAKFPARTAVSHSSFRLHHSLVVMVSSWVIYALLFVIRLYRWTISPVLGFLLGPSGSCRFTPSCSQYAMDAIRSHGALAGGWLAVRRICRCHPWGGCGHDPVLERKFEIRNSKFEI